MRWGLWLVCLLTTLVFAGTALADRGGEGGPADRAPAAEPEDGPAPQGNAHGHYQAPERPAAPNAGGGNDDGARGRSRGRSETPGTPRGKARGQSGNVDRNGNGNGNGRTKTRNSGGAEKRKGGGFSRADTRGDGRGSSHEKTTLCHATGSDTNPYVVVDVNDNSRGAHANHEDDIRPAPSGGCPAATSTNQRAAGSQEQTGTRQQAAAQQQVAGEERAATQGPPDVLAAGGGVLGVTEASPAEGGVLGAAAESKAGDGDVRGATASAGDRELPFTGPELGLVLMLAALALVAGATLRRMSRES